MSADRFTGKVVLVTGGGSGIGRAIAHRFASQGAAVAVVGRRPEPLQDSARPFPDRMSPIVGDVAAPGAASRIVNAVVERFGRLDVVVNNAALWDVSSIDSTTDDFIIQSLMTNQFGPLALIRESEPHLRSSGSGSVVNVSSTGTQVPLPGNAVYASTKAGLEQMTRNLAVDLGPDGIRVNAVSPGATDTDMLMPTLSEREIESTIRRTPLRRIGTPDDVARVVCFLASDDAGWVTGQTIQAAGGFML